MKFGAVPTLDASGAVLAHSVKLPQGNFKKGRVLTQADVQEVLAAGVQQLVVAQLEQDDIAEDYAAQKISTAFCGTHTKAQEAFTGRANIHAQAAGLVVIDGARLQALNLLDESLTIATLPHFARVASRAMVATVKIIPFAISKHICEAALTIIGTEPLIKVVPFQNLKVGLIITQLPHTKPSTILKSEFAMHERVVALGATLADIITCEHTEQAVAFEIQKLNCDVILLFGASAIVDRADVIPAGLVRAGGQIVHLGMPVDPGNLLMLGRMGARPVIGVPSCARSPKLNGFDWVLARVVAGINISPADIMAMGNGGLLAEIASRPSPREQKAPTNAAPRVAALVLAAGKSSRMGCNKLLEDVNGKPMIAQTVAQIAASAVEKVMVVTGFQASEIEAALAGHTVDFILNPHFAEGLATSLRAGVAALQNDYDAILVCLGDMPLIDPRDLNRMIAAFNPVEQRGIVVPVFDRKFGNPVLWGAEHFNALLACEGDRGARSLLEKLRDDVVEISVESQSIILDADTPEALAIIRSIANSAN
jgi:molybdenum cofactor cytidylyltransferase